MPWPWSSVPCYSNSRRHLHCLPWNKVCRSASLQHEHILPCECHCMQHVGAQQCSTTAQGFEQPREQHGRPCCCQNVGCIAYKYWRLYPHDDEEGLGHGSSLLDKDLGCCQPAVPCKVVSRSCSGRLRRHQLLSWANHRLNGCYVQQEYAGFVFGFDGALEVTYGRMLGLLIAWCCAVSQQRQVWLAANLDICEFDMLMAFKSKQLESGLHSTMVVELRDTDNMVKAAQSCDRAVFTVGFWSDVSSPQHFTSGLCMCASV